MFLVDAFVLAQYNMLKEHRYFSILISSSWVVTLTKHSKVMNMENNIYLKQKNK